MRLNSNCLTNVQLETGSSHRQQSENTDVVTLLMLASCFGVPSLVSKLLEAGKINPFFSFPATLSQIAIPLPQAMIF